MGRGEIVPVPFETVKWRVIRADITAFSTYARRYPQAGFQMFSE